MKQQFSFTYPLIGRHGKLFTHLGWVILSGEYKATDGISISSMNVELHATTATEYTEWYRAGGSYEKLEAAAIEHITKELNQGNVITALAKTVLS